MLRVISFDRMDSNEKRNFATITTHLLVFMIAAVLTVQSTMITEISNEYSLSKVGTGYLISSNFLGFALFIILGGLTADSFGKKKVLVLASFSLAVSVFGFFIIDKYIMLCLVFLFVGGSCGIIESIASAYIAELNQGKESFHINISQIFFCFGALIGPYGASLLIDTGWAWRSIYVLISVLVLIVSFLFLYSLRGVKETSNSHLQETKSVKKWLSNKTLLLLCLCMFLYTGSEIGAWSWMVTFMMERLDFSIVESSLAVGVFWISMLVGRMLCTFALRKRSSREIVIFLSIISVFTTAFSAMASTRAAAWIATILLGLSYSSIWPLIISYGSERLENSSGIIFSLMVGSGGLGSALIPVFIGYIGQNVSIIASMLSPVIFFIAISIIFIKQSTVRKVLKTEV